MRNHIISQQSLSTLTTFNNMFSIFRQKSINWRNVDDHFFVGLEGRLPYDRFYFVFRPKRYTGQLFWTFRESFSNFRPRANFFDGPKILQILADSAAIRLVQKSSKSEPFETSKKFARLRFT